MESISFYILHTSILIIAEFIWAFFIFFITLKILRLNEVLFTKKFYYFIISASLTSVVTNRFFEYIVQSAPIASDIWAKVGSKEKLGIILVPTFLLMYIYFILVSSILNLNSRQTLFIVLVLGIATAPWRLLI